MIRSDTGEYTCRATNSKGSAETTARVNVTSLQDAEAPNIVTPLPQEVQGFAEGEKVASISSWPSQTWSVVQIHLECRVGPLTDPRLKAEWHFNGQPLMNASRFKTMFDFGYVSLDILHAYGEDSGTYTCKVQTASLTT